MSHLEPSLKIRSLVIRCIRPPLIWDKLDKINDEVIALEVQNEELRQTNEHLLMELVPDKNADTLMERAKLS